MTLTLNLSKTRNGAQNIALHRALMNWGEGTSNAALAGRGGEGIGIQATTGDVSWFYTFFPTQKWTTPGGDFVAIASASTSVNGVGSYPWTGAGLTADVQQWLNSPVTNFGWIVTGNEASGDTSKEFDTKENTTATARPVLTVNFTPPSPPGLTIAKSHTGNFRQGDPADTYIVNVSNTGSGPTAGTVTVTDTLPTGLSPTAADSGTINGWSVSTSGQTVTATRGDVLASGNSYPSLTLTVSVAANASASVTNTATVAGGGAVNAGSASDPTTITPITQVADLTISKSHAGNFKPGDSADTYTLTVNNIGLGPTAGAVTVTDTLPTGLAPTAADSGTINGWTVTTNGQTITATRGDVLATGTSYPVLTLTVNVSATAPASVTNMATVAGGGEVNTANDSASDPTTITQVANLTISDNLLFLSGLYHDVLGRPADGGGLASFQLTLDAARNQVLMQLPSSFVTSAENRSSFVTAAYNKYLARTPSASEVAGWVSAIQQGMSQEQVTVAFVGSSEYFQRQGSYLPGFARPGTGFRYAGIPRSVDRRHSP